MRPPYPVEIPPLLPLFLNKRRAKMTFPLQKTEELGLDRPTFIWAINLSYRGDRGASAEPGDLTSVYGTIPGRWMPMAAAARASGLTGPEVEVLTRTWREEAADEPALTDLLPHQRPEDVSAALARLRADGHIEPDTLKATPKGAASRQAIEDETDRLFLAPGRM